MTIRLTSVGAFERLLERLKQDPMYSETANATFFKYCVDNIKRGIARGDDEWYLDVDWLPDSEERKVVTVLRYHRRSEIQTDEEYLETDNNI